MGSPSSDRCPACGSPMRLPHTLTGVHRTGSTACRALATKKRLDADELEVVHGQERIQRCLELGAPPTYVVVPGPIYAAGRSGGRSFAAPRWLLLFIEAVGARASAGDAVTFFWRDSDLRAALVAAFDLSPNKKEARVAARAFIDEVIRCNATK